MRTADAFIEPPVILELIAGSLSVLYAVAALLGFALLVVMFKIGLLGRIDILFYRGLVLVAVAFLATFGLLAVALSWRRFGDLGPRDAFAAAALSLSLNLGFLVVVPVTVDRSISIFILAQMAAHPDEVFTPGSMTELFTNVYVKERRQIDRRLYEQSVSGNVQKDGDGYKISAYGKRVISIARIVAWLFDSHAGILAPEPASPSPPGRH